MPLVIYAVEIGQYLISCDVDAFDGRGDARFGSLDEALRFEDHRAAFEYWRRQSTVRPLRADGRPNRPLTAFTVEIQTVP